MAKTVAQLMADADKLIQQAKELEKLQHSKIGDYVMRLYNDSKLTDPQAIVSYIDKVLGKSQARNDNA